MHADYDRHPRHHGIGKPGRPVEYDGAGQDCGHFARYDQPVPSPEAVSASGLTGGREPRASASRATSPAKATPAAIWSAGAEERAADTRRRITTAALDLFTEHGFGATITAIAERAGVAPQTIYATFGTKGAILQALLAQISGFMFPAAVSAC